MEKESNKITLTVERFNVDFSCPVNEFGGIMCDKCERFFDCRSPRKWEIYNAGRMGLVKEKMKRIKHKIAIVGGKDARRARAHIELHDMTGGQV